MNDLSKLSCRDFVDQLASKAPVPGGGGAAALVGAIGVALSNMVGSLTAGKPKYTAVEAEVLKLMSQAEELQRELIELVTSDAKVFRPLAVAYGLPRQTEEQKRERELVLEQCLRECSEVPLRIMEKCCAAIELHEQFADQGAAIAISDVGVGVLCCKAALQGASLNVFINTKSIIDRDYATKINARAQALLKNYITRADRVFADVAASLK